ncbi:hypothetical protein TEA_016612 [Camellia sinensis var. sinensis]|uniref:CST complex subunit TEN1 n=1 Tax=Camellia sinensis var. sinensis TaxID=542762 RepID=A0A4S4DUD5_CAMSN|nr:hypothetical protein TEA_016612 [Camellia sinensis var. sinensis]
MIPLIKERDETAGAVDKFGSDALRDLSIPNDPESSFRRNTWTVPLALEAASHCADEEKARQLQDYSVETALAVIIDGNASLKIDTQHLNVNLRVGSIYQFIGELIIQPTNEAILKARVGRNVDGINLNLYHQSLKLLKEFISDQMSNHSP